MAELRQATRHSMHFFVCIYISYTFFIHEDTLNKYVYIFVTFKICRAHIHI